MTIAKERKQNLFITFYDVAKAYDNADVHNMLYIIWQAGVRGKIWRLLKNMSTNLTAVVKTRYGLSRAIKRENGGRQGSRLTGRLFAKQMDTLCEQFINATTTVSSAITSVPAAAATTAAVTLAPPITATTRTVTSKPATVTIETASTPATKTTTTTTATTVTPEAIQIGFEIEKNFNIGCLEFVDDALSCAVGITNQESTLKKVDEFARANKLEWGESKCEVMQVGAKVNVPQTWPLGEKNIKNTTAYKYLGDMVTNDNKNKQNLIIKENKLQQIIRNINTTASSDIMHGIETKVILALFDKCALTGFLSNSESWTLTVSEEKEVDKIGIQAAKRLFNLPTTTPSVAVIYSLGLLYTTQSIDQRKLMYLHKVLNRNGDNWTTKMLYYLQRQNTGWAKNICDKLNEYNLEPDWEKIKGQTKKQWKDLVGKAIEDKNKEKLLSNCTTTTPQGIKINTKTIHIHNSLTTTTHKRKPLREIIDQNKQKTKTIILARNGMLECGKNFKGTMKDVCQECNKIDDEEHRLNDCKTWNEMNNVGKTRVDFTDIYSEDVDVLKRVIDVIENVWELKYANGKMKRMQ